MKIIVTKTGKKAGKFIIICILIIVAVFFIFYVITKLVEKDRVDSIKSVPDHFLESDISYNNMLTLKSNFSSLHEKISRNLNELKKLHNIYPKNKEIEEKMKKYQSYLDSMNDTSFLCPEHINSFEEQRSQTCKNCGGDGKLLLGRKCKECSGRGEIFYSVTVSQNCPYCGENYKSRITAKSLLK